MAICTQQPKVAFVRLPILKAVGPTVVAVLGSLLFLCVYVVDVEAPKVGASALFAFTAKLFHQLKLALPISVELVLAVPHLVPVCLPALGVTEFVFAGFRALLALSGELESVREIALLIAIFSSPPAKLVGVSLGVFAAPGTRDHNTCFLFARRTLQPLVPRNLFPPRVGAFATAESVIPSVRSEGDAAVGAFPWFHMDIVTQEPKYFDIAVRRMEKAILDHNGGPMFADLEEAVA